MIIILFYRVLHWLFTLYELLISIQLSSTILLINKGSCMSAHVLLNLLNELRKRNKMRGLRDCRAFYLFFAMGLINSIINEHEC